MKNKKSQNSKSNQTREQFKMPREVQINTTLQKFILDNEGIARCAESDKEFQDFLKILNSKNTNQT